MYDLSVRMFTRRFQMLQIDIILLDLDHSGLSHLTKFTHSWDKGFSSGIQTGTQFAGLPTATCPFAPLEELVFFVFYGQYNEPAQTKYTVHTYIDTNIMHPVIYSEYNHNSNDSLPHASGAFTVQVSHSHVPRDIIQASRCSQHSTA